MKNSLKLSLGAVVFSAPILLGFAYSGLDSVGGAADSSHSIDQWTISDSSFEGAYTLDRESIDGVVTLVVTDPDGNIVSGDDLPAAVASSAAEFGDPNWKTPHDNEVSLFSFDANTPCYDEEALLQEANVVGNNFGIFETRDDEAYALERSPDGSVDAAHFDRQVSDEELQAQLDSGNSYMELDGAKPLNAC